jgi:hypothetical protein
MTDCNRNNYDRPKLHLPLALLAGLPASPPAARSPRRAPLELGRLVAAMID